MKRAVNHVVMSVLTIAMLASAWPAAAQFRQRDDGYRGQERQERYERFERRGESPRQAPQRGEAPPARQAGWPGHMSREERQQLRRDIGEHGREIYRDRRDRR